MRIKLLLGVLVSVLPGVVFAECAGSSCVAVKIQEMQIFKDGIVWIQTTGTESNLTTCTASSGLAIKLDTSTAGGKNIYSALLAIQAQGKNTDIRLTDNVTPCQVEYINSL